MQTEANLLQPVQPAHEIPSDLPELRPGQTFNARIQETLPDNTYRALVAGKQLTLQLPEGAKPGDQLELVVIDRSAKVVIARQVEGSTTTADATAPYAYAKFSPAARMIGQLLPADGEAAPPVQLNRGQPLLTQPPQAQSAAATLAPILGKAVTQSGMFYEAHQAQWVSGKLPLEQLLQEPQGLRSSPAAFRNAVAEAIVRTLVPATVQATSQSVAQSNLGASMTAVTQSVPGAAVASVVAGATNPALVQPQSIANAPGANLLSHLSDQVLPLVRQQVDAVATNRLPASEAARVIAQAFTAAGHPVTTENALQALQGGMARIGAEGMSSLSAQAPAANVQQAAGLATQQVPDEMRPLVQQQLEAAASNRVFWHGEVWPRQTMDWAIEWDGEREADGSEEEEARWRTALSLTTPRLGRIEASLQLSPKGVSISLATPDADSAADLRDAAPRLAEALAAAGVPLRGFQVKKPDEYPAGQA
jgi:hypothetical protein